MDVLSRPWAKLQKKLENFLEEDSLSLEEETQIQKNYSLQMSASFLKGFSEGLPEDELDRVAILFSRLMHVFEFGLLLSGIASPLRAIAIFDHGVIRNMRSDCFINQNIGAIPYGYFVAPKSQAFQIRVRGFFPKLRSEDEIMLIRLNSQTVVVVGSQLAKPWLIPHLENVQKSLSEALGA